MYLLTVVVFNEREEAVITCAYEFDALPPIEVVMGSVRELLEFSLADEVAVFMHEDGEVLYSGFVVNDGE